MLANFAETWKNKYDDEGKYLFTKQTVGAIDNQIQKVQYVADVDWVKMYTKIPPRPRSKHKLNQYLSS